MRPLLRWCGFVLAAAACAVAPDPPRAEGIGAHGDARTITMADMTGATQVSLADFVAVERPRWLRGADGRPASIGVYVNDAPVGGAASLRDIALRDVLLARYLDLPAAQQRYGGHVRTPLVVVSTRTGGGG